MKDESVALNARSFLSSFRLAFHRLKSHVACKYIVAKVPAN
jgi:hypothetical protein